MTTPNINTDQETVFVVDDDEAVRDSLRWLLEANGYHVRGFGSADDFLRFCADVTQSNRPSNLVGCLILDVRMPGMSGLELQDALIEQNINLPIIFVTGHGDVPMAVETMKKGAMDFIEKPFDEAELRLQVEKMLSKARQEASSHREQQAAEELLRKLTSREHQVLERIIAGRLNKQIADDLGISIKTVEAHRANIMEKLNVNTVADLLRLALSKRSSGSPRP
ncbi:DNA-binding response regulator [Pandoraea vervacti]|uniref:DNA-binding response regulator n=1 Tax=Pandoraea vervacti TaxID=656178 RepID=A0ABM5SXN7_9BURK|nr:response regulator transcription factor [Pandoraea vervacti]AJP57236.1 DNA-binding response regulator [Pandoraea vervacti]